MRIASLTISGSSASIIADALRSVVDQVDVCVLVDTGVADDTVERARSVVGDKLRVCKFKWNDNFSDARNASISFAREMGCDWGLVVDTDERFSWGESSLRELLSVTATDVASVACADGTYVKEKAIRLTSKVRYYGPVHEIPINGLRTVLRGPVFDELPRTAEHMHHKRLRDTAILADWLADPVHAADGRWWYYLADAHEGLENFEQAIRCFERCAVLRGLGSEEGAWAAYRQAWCLCRLDRYDDAVRVAANGLASYAGTSELAWIAAYASHKVGRLEEARMWAQMSVATGRYIGKPARRELFVYLDGLYEKPFEILKYTAVGDDQKKAEADYELARMARLGVAVGDIDRLCVDPSCRVRDELRSSLRPKPIGSLIAGRAVALEIREEQFAAAGLRGYKPMNPSVCAHKGKLAVLVRMVNYVISDGRYVVSDLDGRVRTINLLGKLNLESGALSDVRPVADLSGGERRASMVLGYEDMRLMSKKGKLWASATVCDRPGHSHQIVLCRLDSKGDVVEVTPQSTARSVEKNWMPVVSGDEIRWVYEVYPTTVRDVSGEAVARGCGLALDHLRGGSQVVPFGGGHLAVCHETVVQQGWGCRRIYLHRFVRFSEDLRVTAVSPAFVFEGEPSGPHYGVEYCSTMAVWDGKLVIGYGVEDREAKLFITDEAAVTALPWIEAPKTEPSKEPSKEPSTEPSTEPVIQKKVVKKRRVA